jgi:photosystem II stability/assembly factor-like uncharacterized protein
VVFALAGVVVLAVAPRLIRAPASPTMPLLTGRIRGIDFVSADTGWVAVSPPNGGGTVFATADGGRHWRRQLTDSRLAPTWLWFLDARSGWAQFTATAATGPGTPDALYHTTDGGGHWALVPLPGGLGPYFRGGQLAVADNDHAWYLAVRIGGLESQDFTLFRTDDGGARWTALITADIGHPLVDGLSYAGFKTGVRFADPRTGSIGQGASGAGASLFLTVDGGANWRLQPLSDPPGGWPQASIVVTRPATVLADGFAVTTAYSIPQSSGGAPVTGPTYVYTSADGGASWSPPRQLPQPAGGTATFLDARHWWVSAGPRLSQTSDGGAHWQESGPAPAGYVFGDVQALDQATAWAVVIRPGACAAAICQIVSRVAVSHDGGRHWSVASPLPPA